MRKPTKGRETWSDIQWVANPTRERLAATRKRTLRSVPARGARSVWSESRSRVIESRKSVDRLGLPDLCRGDSTDVHTVSRHRTGAQAKCTEAGPGSESGAKAQGGILGSWESRPAFERNGRKRTTPAYQRPGTQTELSEVRVSEERKAARALECEGNRSAQAGRSGSLSRLIVAVESRRTSAGRSL